MEIIPGITTSAFTGKAVMVLNADGTVGIPPGHSYLDPNVMDNLPQHTSDLIKGQNVFNYGDRTCSQVGEPTKNSLAFALWRHRLSDTQHDFGKASEKDTIQKATWQMFPSAAGSYFNTNPHMDEDSFLKSYCYDPAYAGAKVNQDLYQGNFTPPYVDQGPYQVPTLTWLETNYVCMYGVKLLHNDEHNVNLATNSRKYPDRVSVIETMLKHIGMCKKNIKMTRDMGFSGVMSDITYMKEFNLYFMDNLATIFDPAGKMSIRSLLAKSYGFLSPDSNVRFMTETQVHTQNTEANQKDRHDQSLVMEGVTDCASVQAQLSKRDALIKDKSLLKYTSTFSYDLISKSVKSTVTYRLKNTPFDYHKYDSIAMFTDLETGFKWWHI